MAQAQPIRIGRYVLHGELAAGGMAAVHFGRLIGTGGFVKTVAIKRLHRQYVRDERFTESIVDEGKLAARIRHPNVVPPLDVLSEGGELLLVMEYVHGEALSKLLRATWGRDESVPINIAVAIMSNVLHGLHAAHEAKDEKGRPLDIVHRDVSPQNVLVGVDGIARVIDFGIAKASSQTDGESTATGIIKGKVPYLAPEQLEGEAATRLTDEYAAAVVMWEVLAGHRLFRGEDDGEILRKIMGMTVEPPSRYNPSVPPSIDEVVLRGLARRPLDRFPTARDMALALENAVHPATASVVGAFTERLASVALAKRAAELAEVEASDKMGTSSRPPPPSHESPPSRPQLPISKRGLSKPPPPPTPPPAAGMPAVGPMSTSFGARTVEGKAVQLSQMPDSQRMPATQRPIVPPGSALDHTAVVTPAAAFTPTGPAVSRLPAAGELRKPALEIPNVDWLPAAEPPKEKSAAGRILAYFAIVVVLLAVVLLACAPLIVKSMVVSGAQERGVALTVERVEVSRRSIKLVDVHIVSNDLPGVSLHASAIDVGTRGLLRPTSITIADIEVLLEGTYPDVTSRIEKYRAAQSKRVLDWSAEVTQLSVVSGRVDWRGVMGVGSHAMLENVTYAANKVGARPLGDDYKLGVPLVKLESGGVLVAGPWQLDTEKNIQGATSTLRLDPTGTFPATVVWTSNDLDAMNMRFDVPRVALSDVHLPVGLLGASTIGTTKVELRGDLTLGARNAPGRPLAGRLFAQASSLGMFPGAPPVDLGLDVPISGDATKPVPVTSATLAVSVTDAAATKTVQYATARVGGTIDITGGKITDDLSGKSTAIPCSGKGETHVEARIHLPLEKMTETKLEFVAVPSCTPRLKP